MTDEHPRYKLGRRPPTNAPALMLGDVLTGAPLPVPPATVDHFRELEFGLYQNDVFGDCGPTSVANLIRLVTGGLLHEEVKPALHDVLDLYRRSGNPNFTGDPNNPGDDNGVVMQDMLSELLHNGIGDGAGGTLKPVAYAKLDVANDDELNTAVTIFGGVLWGVDLKVAQQKQTDATPPQWDYRRASAEWGGHAILAGAFELGDLSDVITWGQRVQTTAAFRQHQLEEAWVVVWPWHLEHPGFLYGVDLDALADAYETLTGRPLPLPEPPPTPPPTPDPDPAPPPEPEHGIGEDVGEFLAALFAWLKSYFTGR